MKTLILILGLINGGYMLLDGIFVVIKGKYIGPEKPGLWSILFEKSGVDVFKLGPLVIVFGVIWLMWAYSLWTGQKWAFPLGVGVCLLTLWYIPIGTLLSLIILAIMIFARQKTGV